MNREALGEEARLEIGDGVVRILGPRDLPPALGARHDLLHPLKIREVVGFEAEEAAALEAKTNFFDEFVLNEASRMVSAFWPWIWKADVDGRSCLSREDIFDGVQVLELENAEILEALARSLFADAFDAADEALGAEEVFFGKAFSHGEQEGALTASKVDFEWGIPSKDVFVGNAIHDGLWSP